MSDEDIRDRIIQLHDSTIGRPYAERIAPLRQAVEMADEIGDEDLGIGMRLAFVSALTFGGRVSEAFVPFAWLVQRHDADSPALTDRYRHGILWSNKWMVDNATDYPQIPLDQIEALLSDMKRRYASAGVGPEPVAHCAYNVVSATRGADAAADEFAAWTALPRCDMSDCQTCSSRGQAGYWYGQGQYERALELLEPVLRGEASCAEEPGSSLSLAAACSAELGRMDEAAGYHLRAWREIRDEEGRASDVARNILLCARSGALARGLELMAHRWEQVREFDAPVTSMHLRAAVARLVGACLAEGMAGRHLLTRTGEEIVIDQALYDELSGQALDLAAAFDARNGNDSASSRVRNAYLEAAPLPTMPLTPGVAGSRSVFAPDGDSQHPLSPGPDEIADAGVMDLMGLADRIVRWGGLSAERALLARWRELREKTIAQAGTSDDPDFQEQVALAELNITGLDPDLRVSAELESNETGIRLLQASGRPDRALGVEYWLAMTITHDQDRADELLARIRATGSPGRVLSALNHTPLDVDSPEACRRRREELLALGVTPGSEPRERNALGHLLLQAGSAPDLVRNTWGEVESYFPDPDEFPSIRQHLGMSRISTLWNADERDEAMAVCDRLIEYHSRMGTIGFLANALGQRALMSETCGDAPEAEHYYQRALAAAQASGRRAVVTNVRWDLADLLMRQGRTVEAIEIVEQALADLEIPDDPYVSWSPDQMLYQRANLLHMGARLCQTLGESDRAVSLARRGAADAQQLDAPGAAAFLLGIVGDELRDADAVESLRAYTQAVEQARAAGDEMELLRLQRRRMWAAADADGLDAGLAVHAEAAEVGQALRDRVLADTEFAERTNIDIEMTMLDVAIDRVRLLATHRAYDQALSELGDAPEQILAHGNEEFAASALDLRARIRLAVNDERVAFTDIAAGMELADRMQDARLRGEFAALGANWLDREGRSDEAERFWAANNGQQE